jgi:hypothetical protein
MTEKQLLERIAEIDATQAALASHLAMPWERMWSLFPQNRAPAENRDAAVKLLVAERDALCQQLCSLIRGGQ